MRRIRVPALVPQQLDRHGNPLRPGRERSEPEHVTGEFQHASRDQAEQVRLARHHEYFENLRHLEDAIQLEASPYGYTGNGVLTVDAWTQRHERTFLQVSDRTRP